MPDNASTKVPVLEPPLEAGEGRLINIVADYAKKIRESADKTEWQELIDYLKSDQVSKAAKQLGLHMLGEKSEEAPSEDVKKVAEWYLKAAENDKRLAKLLFKGEH